MQIRDIDAGKPQVEPGLNEVPVCPFLSGCSEVRPCHPNCALLAVVGAKEELRKCGLVSEYFNTPLFKASAFKSVYGG